MKNLKQVLVFVRVAERLSFKGAAAELRMSTSAASRHVTQLEEELGVQLLRRSTRRIALTDAGATYLAKCRHGIQEIEAAGEAAQAHRDSHEGSLRLQATFGVGQTLLAPALRAFCAEYPKISVDLTIGPLPAKLIENNLDAVMVHRARIEDVGVETYTLATVEYLICAAPSFLACHGRPERPKDLARFNCLVQTTQQGAEDWRIRDGEREIHVHVRGNFRTNDGVVLREAVLDGLGIGRLPEYAVSEDIRDGRLVVLFRDVVSWGRTITLAFPRPRHGTARMRLLLDFLERYIKERLAVRS